ncbi:PRTRC system protein E [Novosphingobium piscinae]|uniref:PRTRC system protein E n=1 Tax=Novosphingobium piscinae TaxID=1507448 RepID=A0A7X1KPS9_9SPHN|nr:PRTRC system protein E [Novosphingobium piscinae]MBC2668745.1 PRTRC system protein E [Novosphingobium piscinae]
MLITNLLPLLARYSLGFDLVAGAGNMVTLTIIPRKAEGAKVALEPAEARPISITGTAEEIDEQLALGTEGALSQIFVARVNLAEQLAEQRKAVEDAKAAASAKAKPAAKVAPTPTAAPAPAPAPAAPAADEPLTLY